MKLACKTIEDLLPLYCDDACTEETRALVEAHLQDCDSCRALCEKIREELSIPCRLIDDLLPLYHDGACSNETRALVDMHLNSCKACRAKLAEIGNELKSPPRPDELKPLKKIRLEWIRARKKQLLKGVAIGLLCVAIASGAFFGLTQWRFISIPGEDVGYADISRMADGSIGFYLSIPGLNYLNEIDLEVRGDEAYIIPRRAVFEISQQYYGVCNNAFYFITFEPTLQYEGDAWIAGEADSDFAYDEDSQLDYNSRGIPDFWLPDCVEYIYVGAPGEHAVLIWEAGDELPAAREYMEEAYLYNYK